MQKEGKKLKRFSEMPLSDKTLRGLQEEGFEEATEVQRDSLPFSLTGANLVASAKTGSGKTLALVIPVSYIRSCTKPPKVSIKEYFQYFFAFISTQTGTRHTGT